MPNKTEWKNQVTMFIST